MWKHVETVLVCMSLVLGVSAWCHAGGRTGNPPNPLAQSITFNAWCRDGVIEVAVCNLGGAAQKLKVAVGAYDTTEHLFASQSFVADPGTISPVRFPVMKRATPRGDMQQSDSAFVFVESGGENLEVGCMPVQRVYPRKWEVSADNYVVRAGQKVMLTYKEKPGDAMRMVFIAKAASPACTVDPIQKSAGNTQAMTIENLNGLGLVPEAVRTYADLLKDNYGWIIQKGAGGRINFSCTAGAVDGCKAATVPIERHVVEPAGGTAGGMGPTVLVYDPKTITLKPVLHLHTTQESEEGSLNAPRLSTPASDKGQPSSAPAYSVGKK